MFCCMHGTTTIETTIQTLGHTSPVIRKILPLRLPLLADLWQKVSRLKGCNSQLRDNSFVYVCVRLCKRIIVVVQFKIFNFRSIKIGHFFPHGGHSFYDSVVFPLLNSPSSICANFNVNTKIEVFQP